MGGDCAELTGRCPWLEGVWPPPSGSDDTEIHPTNNSTMAVLAITRDAFVDFTVTLEFNWRTPWTGAGFVFGATDATNYFVIDFPAAAQQQRAEHFWAVLSRVDNRYGWRHALAPAELVHGVSSSLFLWHTLKVTAAAGVVSAWIDGRPILELALSRLQVSNAGGRLGLATYSGLAIWSAKTDYRNVEIAGRPVDPPPPWDESVAPRIPWGHVAGVSGEMCNALLADPYRNGSMVLVDTGIAPAHDTISRGHIATSHDGGRSFQLGEAISTPTDGDVGSLFRFSPTQRGILERYSVTRQPPFAVIKDLLPAYRNLSSRHESDSGTTANVSTIRFPYGAVFSNLSICSLITANDGHVLLSALAQTAHPPPPECGNKSGLFVDGRYCKTMSQVKMALVLRSTDRTAEAFETVDIDGYGRLKRNCAGTGKCQSTPGSEESWMIEKEASEISLARGPRRNDSRVLALVRPFYAPHMWESWSPDHGANWGPLTRGPFAMYASCNSMITTRSGVMIIGGRFPGISLQASWDGKLVTRSRFGALSVSLTPKDHTISGGMSWVLAQIDVGMWANGAMAETHEDVTWWYFLDLLRCQSR